MQFTRMDELKDIVDLIVEAFPEKLGHIESNKILYSCFSQPKSNVKARIVPIQKRYEIFLDEGSYILEIHKESWEVADEGLRLYIILHELTHIPSEGFNKESKEYKKTIKHDLEDFKDLVRDYGVDLEKVDQLVEKIQEAEKNG